MTAQLQSKDLRFLAIQGLEQQEPIAGIDTDTTRDSIRFRKRLKNRARSKAPQSLSERQPNSRLRGVSGLRSGLGARGFQALKWPETTR
jgi:hypothetical protein